MTDKDDIIEGEHPEESSSVQSAPPQSKLRQFLFGKPKSLREPSLFHKLSLIPVLAWIGLGADGLSSACYGPEEAFRAVAGHNYLAIGLAIGTALTVFLIAAAYSRVIEEFPNGGGGYVVASKLLGPKWGVLSGSALLIDYVLTIAVSIVAAGDALFSLVPLEWHFIKLPLSVATVGVLIILNIRGVKESVLALAPIFILFVLTHALLIGYGIFSHTSGIPAIVDQSIASARIDSQEMGLIALIAIFIHAFSLGGGTYTGIEAVSNATQILREPRVQTGKRTMIYMAVSLSITAAGLLICYLLWDVKSIEGKTMNASLADSITSGIPGGAIFVLLTMLSAGAVLIVAAQAGFLGGPRILSNMAVDRWAPSQFAHLSERLTTQNGIILMGCAAALVMLGTGGNIHHLIVMYSINVFLTFTLTMVGMLRFWVRHHWRKGWFGKSLLFSIGALLCGTILFITVKEKFTEGGWITVASTGTLVFLFIAIRRHYDQTSVALQQLEEIKKAFPESDILPAAKTLEHNAPTAAILVGGYTGLGLHTLLAVRKAFPDQFENVVFLSVGFVDTSEMQSPEHLSLLNWQTEHDLQLYIDAARQSGYSAESRWRIGTDVVEEGVALCESVAIEFPNCTFFAGQIAFKREAWYHRLLHNQTAFSIQRHLIWQGRTMVVLPIRVFSK